MATSKVSPNADELVSEIAIAAPPERVFQALTDPAQVLKWWGHKGFYETKEFQADLRPKGKWRTAGIGGQAGTFEVTGEYLEIDPPRVLSYTWVASWTGDVQTTVRWELEPTKDGTLVRIRHMGFAAHPEIANNYKGWPNLLGWLRALLERGETVDDRK